METTDTDIQPDIGRRKRPYRRAKRSETDTVGFLKHCRRLQIAGAKIGPKVMCRIYHVSTFNPRNLPDMTGMREEEITEAFAGAYRQQFTEAVRKSRERKKREPQQGILPLGIAPVLPPLPPRQETAGDTIESLVNRLKTLGAKAVTLTF